MASKQEWLEYFEAMNGRPATAEEIVAALDNGDFTTTPTAPGASEFKADADKIYREVKKETWNYFGWLWQRVLRPTTHAFSDTKPNVTFLWVTFGLAVFFGAAVVWNYMRRLVNVMIPMSGTTVPSAAGSLVLLFLVMVVVLVLAYGAGLLMLLWTARATKAFGQKLNSYLGFMPLLLAVNVVAVLGSGLMPMPSLMLGYAGVISYITTTTYTMVIFSMIVNVVLTLAQYALIAHERPEKSEEKFWYYVMQSLVTAFIVWIIVSFIAQPMITSVVTDYFQSLK